MKKTAVIFLIFITTFAFCFSFDLLFEKTQQVNKNSISSKKVNLVVDAGHGGADSGTVGVDGAKEKEINLAIALSLYDFAAVCGINTQLTRDGDYLVYDDDDDKSRSDLYNRMDFINSVDNAVLISIHQNHFEDEKENGMQIWYSPNDSKSEILAEKILFVTKKNLQPKNERENKKSDDSYYLLYKASVPSVMVECGFMSNTKENKKLQDGTYQKKLAYSIMLGFLEYASEES